MSTSLISVITNFRYHFSMAVVGIFLDKDLIQITDKFSTSDELYSILISTRKVYIYIYIHTPKRTLPGG